MPQPLQRDRPYLIIALDQSMCFQLSGFSLVLTAIDAPGFATLRHNNVAILRYTKLNAIGLTDFATRQHDNLAILCDTSSTLSARLASLHHGTTA